MIKIFDGAMGTMLQMAGFSTHECPEYLNITQPDVISKIHKQYVSSGANIIETNTFGANRIKLQHYGLDNEVEKINSVAVKLARQAGGTQVQVAGSVGPTGKLIAPLGELAFEEAYTAFLQQIKVLVMSGVDYIIIETMIDLQEMRAALLAAKACTAIPIICQMSFGADGRTATGTDPRSAGVVLEAMGASIVGANCSTGPEKMVEIICELAGAVAIPVSAQANAGMPRLIDGKTVFDMGPEQMAYWVPKLIGAGATYIGGCCGTTPLHIQAMVNSARDVPASTRQSFWLPKTVVVASRSQTVALGAAYPTAVIGERINPTGRKHLVADIRNEQYIEVKKEALAQVRAGAKILDINVGAMGLDQKKAMKEIVEKLAMLVEVPLAIDSTSAEVMEIGLRAFPGRAIINSVTAETERMAEFLPLAKKYGAAIICLPISNKGLAKKAAERITVISEIIKQAKAAGLRDNDFLLDALVLTAASDSAGASMVLETLRCYRDTFGYPAVMGLSNVSHGLPRRELLNATFLAMAVASGVDAPIMNPCDPLMTDVLAATAVLNGEDDRGALFSKKHSMLPEISETAALEESPVEQIRQAVLQGEKERIVPLTQNFLAQGIAPTSIMENGLTAAMNRMGELFATGKCYLPQVLLAAETMRAAFDVLKAHMPVDTMPKYTVVLATVKGDIHDLGKNIVAALMENNGFRVVDLGKDVAAEDIVAAAKQNEANIVGLCALMTTTMPQIDTTIVALNEAGVAARVIVGGAVMTQEYAKQAGADAYAADGMAAVMLAQQLIGEKL